VQHRHRSASRLLTTSALSGRSWLARSASCPSHKSPCAARAAPTPPGRHRATVATPPGSVSPRRRHRRRRPQRRPAGRRLRPVTVLVCDTGPLVAALSPDPDHHACVELFTGMHLARRDMVLPAPVVAEVGYLLGSRAGPPRNRRSSDPCRRGLPHPRAHHDRLHPHGRAGRPLRRPPLGTTDAAVITVAERLHVDEDFLRTITTAEVAGTNPPPGRCARGWPSSTAVHRLAGATDIAEALRHHACPTATPTIQDPPTLPTPWARGSPLDTGGADARLLTTRPDTNAGVSRQRIAVPSYGWPLRRVLASLAPGGIDRRYPIDRRVRWGLVRCSGRLRGEYPDCGEGVSDEVRQWLFAVLIEPPAHSHAEHGHCDVGCELLSARRSHGPGRPG